MASLAHSNKVSPEDWRPAPAVAPAAESSVVTAPPTTVAAAKADSTPPPKATPNDARAQLRASLRGQRRQVKAVVRMAALAVFLLLMYALWVGGTWYTSRFVIEKAYDSAMGIHVQVSACDVVIERG